MLKLKEESQTKTQKDRRALQRKADRDNTLAIHTGIQRQRERYAERETENWEQEMELEAQEPRSVVPKAVKQSFFLTSSLAELLFIVH